MPKIKSAFVAYRHTGESPEVLEPMLSSVVKGLNKLGIETYCTFFSESDFQDKSHHAQQIMEHAFKTIENKDLLFVVMASQQKSEGMLMEVGRFYGRKPIVVARHKDVRDTYVPEMADLHFEWNTPKELTALTEQEVAKLL